MGWVWLILGVLLALFVIGVLWEQVIRRFVVWLIQLPFWGFFWRHVGIGFRVLFVLGVVLVVLYIVMAWLTGSG